MKDTVKGRLSLENKAVTKNKTLSIDDTPATKKPTLSAENLTGKDGHKVEVMVKSRRHPALRPTDKTKTAKANAATATQAKAPEVGTAKPAKAVSADVAIDDAKTKQKSAKPNQKDNAVVPEPATDASTTDTGTDQDVSTNKGTGSDQDDVKQEVASPTTETIDIAERIRLKEYEKTKILEERRRAREDVAQKKDAGNRNTGTSHEKDKKKRQANGGAGEGDGETSRKNKSLRKDRAGRLSRDKAFDLDEETPRRRKIRSKIKRSSKMSDVGVFEKPETFVAKEIDIPDIIAVGELANRMSIKARDLITVLFKMGVMKTINEVIDQDTAVLCVEEVGHKAKLVAEETIEDQHIAEQEMVVESGDPRAPVVTVMGHVDHGKTSLLDYIRNTKVASSEAGGITQHIGAYHVDSENGSITFLDTPGHADFTAMRARGTKLTDIVVLVIAADDGVMPQTIEAIQHAKKANVPIVTAVTKTDLEGWDIERIKADMAANDLTPEEWGGDTQIVSISVKTGNGVSELLEAIHLQAELLELKAVIDTTARGVVIESSLDKGRGPVSTLLVSNGTLKIGNVVVAGETFGRVRALLNEHGQRINQATPSIPVEVLGFNAIPEVGDAFAVVADEKRARELAEFRRERSDEKRHITQHAARLDDMFKNMESSEKTTMNIIIKTDVRGSLEAIEQSIRKLNVDNEEIHVNIVGSGVGGISESDALFAQTSDAVLFGFNVRADSAAKKVIEKHSVSLRYYSVIYELVDHLKVMLSEMMAPELSEEIVGTAEVRDVFNSQRYGLIAGCVVISGNVYRNKPVRILRDSKVIYEGELESLRRIKDDVDEVRGGVECGIGIRNYQDVRVGDAIESYDVKEIARTI